MRIIGINNNGSYIIVPDDNMIDEGLQLIAEPIIIKKKINRKKTKVTAVRNGIRSSALFFFISVQGYT